MLLINHFLSDLERQTFVVIVTHFTDSNDKPVGDYAALLNLIRPVIVRYF